MPDRLRRLLARLRVDRAVVVRAVVTAAVVIAVFAAAGAVAGWLWHQLWTPPAGKALQGGWYAVRGDSLRTVATDETSLGQEFGATGLFIVIGAVGGLVLGLLAALIVRRSELLMLVAVSAGGVLATFVCYRVGMHLSPPDPATVAATAPDLTPIPDAMEVSGKSPYVSWVLGSLVGLGFTYLLTSASTHPAPAPPILTATPYEGLSGNQLG